MPVARRTPLAHQPPPMPVDGPAFTCTACAAQGTPWTIGQCASCGTCASCCRCHQPRGRMGGPFVAVPNAFTFWGTPDPVIPRHFGVEVECGLTTFRGPLAGLLRPWGASCGTDCSVGDGRRLQTPPAGYQPVDPAMAVEVRTPPATGDAARAFLQALGVALAAHGAHTDSTCGLHAHVDNRSTTADDLARLAMGWSKIDGAL